MLPTKEHEVNEYCGTSVKYLIDNKVELGISPTDITDITAKEAERAPAYKLAINPTTRTVTTIAERDRITAEEFVILRRIYGDIPDSKLSQAARDILLITERTYTHIVIPLPKSNPVGKLIPGERLKHTIHIVDSDSGKKAQPAGVSACEVWRKVGGTAPASEKDLSYVGSTANHTFTCTFDGTEAGEMVNYWIRWVNSKNDKGTWGQMFGGNVQG